MSPKRNIVSAAICHASMYDLPEAPDYLLSAVPMRMVAEAIEALGGKRCKTASLFPAGFAGVGKEGVAAREGLV